MTVGEILKELRLEAGLTQTKLSKLCGIADSNIRKYETEKQFPKWSTIEKIVNALLNQIEDFDYELFEKLCTEAQNDQTINMIVDLIGKKYFKKPTIDIISLFAGTKSPEIKAMFSHYKYEYLALETFKELNEQGQQKALEQIELIAQIPEYRKDTE